MTWQTLSRNGEVPSGRLPLVPHFSYCKKRGHGLRRIGPSRISATIAISHIVGRRRNTYLRIGPRRSQVVMRYNCYHISQKYHAAIHVIDGLHRLRFAGRIRIAYFINFILLSQGVCDHHIAWVFHRLRLRWGPLNMTCFIFPAGPLYHRVLVVWSWDCPSMVGNADSLAASLNAQLKEFCHVFKYCTENPGPGSKSRPHLEQQGGSEKLWKARLFKLGVWIGIFA